MSTRHWLAGALLAAGVLRLGMAVYSGLDNDRGDFYATMPGAFAETLNPALWNSEDLAKSWAYKRSVYLYGPTQYLTLAPFIYLFDSYRSLARALLVVYTALIVLAAWMLWKTFQAIRPVPAGAALTAASTFMFFPVLQALMQREFEVVVLFVSVCAAYFAVVRREAVTGALVAYMVWFKFLPLAWLPYLALRRWWRAVAAFVAVSALIVGITHLWLGLAPFQSVWTLSERVLTERSSADGLCAAWTPEQRRWAIPNHHFADVPWALCRFADWWPMLSAPAIYAALLAVSGATFLFTFLRLERAAPLDAGEEGWRRLLEVSAVVIASSVLVHAEYYYLSLLVIPLNALLLRYLSDPQRGWLRPLIWTAAYVTLGAFVLPLSVLARIIGSDFWVFYMRHGLYFIGEVSVLALVLWEYSRVGLRAPDSEPAVLAA
jgi:hypothetical protein